VPLLLQHLGGVCVFLLLRLNPNAFVPSNGGELLLLQHLGGVCVLVGLNQHHPVRVLDLNVQMDHHKQHLIRDCGRDKCLQSAYLLVFVCVWLLP
jgi:hypothetical protein